MLTVHNMGAKGSDRARARYVTLRGRRTVFVDKVTREREERVRNCHEQKTVDNVCVCVCLWSRQEPLRCPPIPPICICPVPILGEELPLQANGTEDVELW